MKYINLIDKLSDEDKEKLNNYILKFGVSDKNYFIGLDAWLNNWSHSKQRLYKLFGNQFIKEFPFSYEKEEYELLKEVREKLFILPFKASYHNFYIYLKEHKNDLNITDCILRGFSSLTDFDVFIYNKVNMSIKYKRPDKPNMLQIQIGTKPMKAFGKVINYFNDIFKFDGFEEFRIAHSLILNDKIINGALCLSIHPLDFITMSDNSLNWSSCMSWIEGGCYHQGTVEMMNSNNVICCYLKGKDDFVYGPSKEHIWNNKKWRVLCYVTKDIIMTGKSYPYRNESLCREILNHMRVLAKENMNWSYSFGPELYKDMIHINNNNQMERNHRWIRAKSTTKHNILFDTKGMYNDMLNDHYTHYWCIRNKVNNNKIISVSGKSVCLCCGDSVIKENYECDDDWEDDYNDRFVNCGENICDNCLDNFLCDQCNERDPKIRHIEIEVNGLKRTVCEYCFKARIRICPCCGQVFYISNDRPLGYVNLSKTDHDNYEWFIGDEVENLKNNYCANNHQLKAIYVCKDCKNHNDLTFEDKTFYSKWGHKATLSILINEPNAARYGINNLEKPDQEIYSMIGN